MLNFEIRKKYFTILTKKILDIYATITGIPPLSLPNSKGKNLKSYSISGNVDESIIGYGDANLLPDGYTLLDYIGTTGTQYLTISSDMQYDTSDIDISIVCTVSAISSTQQTIIGSYDNQWNLWTINNQMGFYTNGKATDRYTGIASNTKISVRIYQNQTVKKLFVDGNEITTNDTPVINALGLQLFAYSNGTAKLSGRIYSVSGHISNTQLNLVPCINSNGEIGMYDAVGNKFHGNAGTGTFTKSPVNLLRTLGRTEQTVSGNAQTKRILQGDKYVFLTANNNVSAETEVTITEGGVSFSRLSGGHGVAFPVKLKPNHNYTAYANVSATTTTATMNIRISFYEADGTWISTWYQGNVTNNGMTLKSFTVPSNADMTLIVCAKNNTETGTAPTITFSNIVLIEGVYTTPNAPAYTPYKQLLTDINGVGDYDNTANKYKIPVLSAGKNLLNGTVIRNDYVSNRSHLAEGTYIFSCDVTNATKWRFDMNVYDENGNKIPTNVYNITPSMYITASNGLRVSSDTTLSTIKFSLHRPADVIFTIAAGDTTTSTTVTNAQIEVGSERTEYETYVQPTSNNIFINNSLLKTGENADIVNYPQNKTVKAVGKYVFTGTETIELYDNSKGFRFAVSDMETGNCIDGYCNRFENFKNITDNDIPRVFFGYNNNYVYFRRFSETATTAEDIKSTLADWYSSGKPLTIWYPLEKETEEAISLPDIPTVQGSAAIMVDTSVQPSGMSVEYAIEGA